MARRWVVGWNETGCFLSPQEYVKTSCDTRGVALASDQCKIAHPRGGEWWRGEAWGAMKHKLALALSVQGGGVSSLITIEAPSLYKALS